MPLVTSKAMLEDAYQNQYAIGAFATHNLEIMKAVVEAAEELHSPVIFQTTPETIKYLGLKKYHGDGQCSSRRGQGASCSAFGSW